MSTASPCIDICKFDSETGYCIGCLRTRDECKSWKKMKDKHNVGVRSGVVRRRPRQSRHVALYRRTRSQRCADVTARVPLRKHSSTRHEPQLSGWLATALTNAL